MMSRKKQHFAKFLRQRQVLDGAHQNEDHLRINASAEADDHSVIWMIAAEASSLLDGEENVPGTLTGSCPTRTNR